MSFWAGYSVTARDVTGVRAQWLEPDVSGVARSSEFLWVGIGSWNATPVVQTGTYVLFPGGRYEERGPWYECYPRNSTGGITGKLSELPEDAIEAAVVLLPGAGHRWRLTVRDVSTGAKPWTKIVSYKIAHTDADFIVEDPSVNAAGKLAPFAKWGAVLFSHMQVRVGQHWIPAGDLHALRINMVQHGKATATTGPLGSDGASFTAIQH